MLKKSIWLADFKGAFFRWEGFMACQGIKDPSALTMLTVRARPPLLRAIIVFHRK
jgi:hypothetical protein